MPDGSLDIGGGRSDTPQTQSVMRVSGVRRFVVARGVSAFGSAVTAVAVAYVAYSVSGSTVLTVVALGVNAVPALILAPLVGRLSVRNDPRFIAAIGQVVKVVLSGILVLLAARGDLTYPALLVLNTVNGAVSAFAAPAWPRLNRMSVPANRLTDMTAAVSGMVSVTTLIGAVIGGVIISKFGTAWAFAVNAASYLPLIVAIRLVPGDVPTTPTARRTLRTGVTLVRENDVLRRAFVLAAVLNLAAWPVLSMLPAMATSIDSHAHVLGFLFGAFYAGAAAVSYATTRLSRRYSYGTILFRGFLGAGLLLLLNAALTGWRTPGYDALSVAMATLLPIGLALALDTALLQALVQLSSPGDRQAPVLVVYATVTTVLVPLGGLAIGTIGDTVSLWVALSVAGTVLCLVTLVVRRQLSIFDELNPVKPEDREHIPWGRHLHASFMIGDGLLHEILAGLHDMAGLEHHWRTHGRPGTPAPPPDPPDSERR